MLTFLDLLVIVFMALAGLSLFSVCLMFLVKHQKVRKVCFYIAVALGVYAASVSLRISQGLFLTQMTLGVLFGLLSVAALVLERVRNKDEKAFFIARILAAVALVAGLINAIL